MFRLISLCCVCAATCLSTQELPPPSVRFRVQSFARERAPITNPISWVQLLEREEEGRRVEKGDVVFTLDLQGTRDSIDNLENRLETEDNRSAKDVANMKSTLQNLIDRRETLLDNRRIQEARLNYLKSLPKQEDVSISRGRRNVARERLEAEKKNLETMRERLDRNLIAPLQVRQAEWSTEIQAARTRYAEQMLEIRSRPARPEDLELVSLRIENLDLEIDKLNKEIATEETILGIRQASRARRVKNIREDLAGRKEELDFGTLEAPRDGVLLYTPQLKRILTEGSKPSKGMVIGEIPEPDSVAFSGVIPEQKRHLFNVGDPVELELNIMPAARLQGRLLTISPFSRDAVEDDELSSGVKVVDVEVELSDPPDHLPIGIYGWATLQSLTPLTGHHVPLSWVRYQAGKPHLSVKGTYQPVDGIAQGGRFVLTPPHPPPSGLMPEGEWEEETEGIDLDTGNRFTASGELMPLESRAVTAPQVRTWDMKITWAYPENQQVEAGEVVARLDSQMIEDRLKNRIENAERGRGERNSAEEKLAMKRVESAFRLSSATNQVQIAKLQRQLVLTRDTDSAVEQATMNLKVARIRLEMAEADLARGERTPELTAPAEREKRKRELARKRLELNRAEIELKKAREGATEIEKSLADVNALRAEETLAREEAVFKRDLSRLQSHLQWRVRREQRNERQLKQAREDQESLTLTAPVSGLVRYAKIWDGVRTSKIRPGMRIWPRNVLISLSNTREVYVEVPLPERYVHKLKPGMEVQVVVPGEGNLQAAGRVTEIGALLEPASQDGPPSSVYSNQESTREQILPVKVVVDSGRADPLNPGAIAQLIFPFKK